MFQANSLPSVTPRQLAEMLENGREFILLDVREPLELMYASLGDAAVNVPLSKLAEYGTEVLPEAITADQAAEVVVMCHHGVRSAQVVAWLRQQGWTHVFNLTGGIDGYATAVDPAVGTY
ncbi:MAG: hypothetical protein KC425_08990 [Anaerolineales bacterium]|nr:hypothetical protein [Anaerolineales bacterium]